MSSTQSTPFTYFRNFPPEIQLEILNHCTRNDLVCLSLTNHDFRAFITPLIKSKPHLEWVDQLGTTPDVPQSCPLEKSDIYHRSYCKGVRGNDVHYNRHAHRVKRHATPARACFKCEFYPPDHPTCQVPFCKKHCMCISCPLFIRLRGWMGERRYCSQCKQFTTRNKKNKGRCTHGRVRERKRPNNHWTYTKGASYGYRWWRRWGTCSVDNEAYTPDAKRRPNARVV
ncbi:F-box domain-containing protein [Fusarium venenatum]|uniref:F-box domain-containing protein n=1 Tax=Fusarium venenatum TaxID=56646 RepID=UPI001DDD09EB|nr:F-box domain-containing protein [Fusarium venenatum]